MGRATQGVTLIALDGGTRLSNLQRVVERDSDVVNGDNGHATAVDTGSTDDNGSADEPPQN